MKPALIHSAFVVSLLIAGFAFLSVPEAGASLSKRQVERCLTGRFPVRMTETIRSFDALGDPAGTRPVNSIGGLRIGRGTANFKGLLFKYRQVAVRGRNRVIIRGGVRSTSLIGSAPGSLKIVIVKRRGRAQITTGKFTWTGLDRATGNTQLVIDGALFGSKRLSRKCQRTD